MHATPEPGSVRVESAPDRAPSERTGRAGGLPRRSVAAAMVVFPALWLGARAQPAAARMATPSQTEGPFYPVRLPSDSDNDLLRNGTLNYRGGQPAWVDGSVTDLDGKPLRGAQ